jgi:hypothetical protein
MQIPKPCEGRLSDEAQVALARNRNRDQFALQTCAVCGVRVGAIQAHGKWVPEQHWPSVKYRSRVAADVKHAGSAGAVPDEVAILIK